MYRIGTQKWVTEVTWMHMLFSTLLAQWIHQSARLPEFFYPTFSWNHTLQIELYDLEVMWVNVYQTIMLIIQSLQHLNFKGQRWRILNTTT